MAELAPLDRLQPCLLDRLTDHEPEVTGEGRDQRVISVRKYREAVLRDLEMLLNSRTYPPGHEIYDFVEVERSVLNYGVPDLAGTTASSISADEFAGQMKQAILWFEPRISRRSLSVHIVPSPERGCGSAVLFEVEGDLWAHPFPEHLFVKTEVDLETGRYNLKGETSE